MESTAPFFSIVTPDHGRESIIETIKSIAAQDTRDFEHVIVFDGSSEESLQYPFYQLYNAIRDYPLELQEEFGYSNFKVRFTGERANDFGHTPRTKAGNHVEGMYVLYIDTDDTYAPNALTEIRKGLEAFDYPTFLFFPCRRLGERFFNHPSTRFVTSIQYAHARLDNEGNPIIFTPGGYNHDNEWLYEMTNKYDHAMHNTKDELVYVDVISKGL